jgi:hypothetical protein
VCESKIRRQTGVARFLLWFTEAYMKNIFIIVFVLTRPVLEPTIYRTRDEHANHYSTDAICSGLKRLSWLDEPTGTKGKGYVFRIETIYSDLFSLIL